MFYSATANTWYDPEFRASYEESGSWPDDATEYPDHVYEQVVRDRPANKVMVADVDGNPVLIYLPAPDNEQLIAQYTSLIQSRLDNFARTRNYDNVNSSAKYKDISDDEIDSLPAELHADVIKFRAECRYLALKAAETWARGYAILGSFQISGEVPSIESVEAQLPLLEWPN